MNNYNAIGRVGRDAVTRYTQAGKPVTGWALAVDKGWGDNKQTVWLDCSLWGERGEKLAQHITKGSQLGVTGEIGTREHDGKTYVTLDVRDVTLVGGKQEGNGGGSNSGAPARQRPARATDSVPSAAETASEFADDDIPFVTKFGPF
ncbi:single-stranded DNA-binding protein [Stenotrophomonas sp. UBA7606]|uniref:single-stranded DNA-binding protein n=1 Tax=Stenotrophomonas sp. UBA7606 TaxID=1947559 RepID=UPI0025CC1AFE|nr:single-stranded DNA-binding protein [Stenotrophomonas sp. UBA7606]